MSLSEPLLSNVFTAYNVPPSVFKRQPRVLARFQCTGRGSGGDGPHFSSGPSSWEKVYEQNGGITGPILPALSRREIEKIYNLVHEAVGCVLVRQAGKAACGFPLLRSGRRNGGGDYSGSPALMCRAANPGERMLKPQAAPAESFTCPYARHCAVGLLLTLPASGLIPTTVPPQEVSGDPRTGPAPRRPP